MSKETKISSPVTICYCGADMPWEELESYGFRRRNTYLLKGFIEESGVERVLVFTNVTRETLLKRIRASRCRSEKVKDIYVAAILPERKWLVGSRFLNRLFYKLLIRWQAGSLQPGQNVVWCYWPKGFQLAKKLELCGTWVFDADHNIIDDVNLEGAARAERKQLLMECAKRTQLIVAGARSMLEWFAQAGVSHCAYLRNGIELTRFHSPGEVPGDIEPIPGPRIGYLGTLSRWIDYDLFVALARKRPDWSFIVIGDPYKNSAHTQFEDIPNISFLGSRSAEEVPAYLASFDIALSLYNSQYPGWLDVDSMKIFEYLAAGLPVVSTPFHPNLEADFANLIQTATTADEFVEEIERLLNTRESDKAEWNGKRQAFLAENTWQCRTREAMVLIQGLGKASL